MPPPSTASSWAESTQANTHHTNTMNNTNNWEEVKNKRPFSGPDFLASTVRTDWGHWEHNGTLGVQTFSCCRWWFCSSPSLTPYMVDKNSTLGVSGLGWRSATMLGLSSYFLSSLGLGGWGLFVVDDGESSIHH